MKKRTCIMVVLFAIFTITFLSATEDGGLPGAFLRIPIGPRPAGLGYAFTGISDDINTLYYNPGGLYQTDKISFGGSYTKHSLDRSLNQVGIIYPLKGIGKFGLQIRQFGISSIDGRDPQGNPTPDFDDSRLSVDLGYGREIIKHFGIGANFKYISHSLAGSKARGIGFDTGLHFRKMLSQKVGTRLGLSLNNIETSLKWDTESSLQENVPYTLRVGSAFNIDLSKRYKFLICADGVQTKDMDFTSHFGVESTMLFKNMIFELRSGLNGSEFNAGFSIKLHNFSVDYAYCSDVLEERPTHSMGISYNFADLSREETDIEQRQISNRARERKDIEPSLPDVSPPKQDKKIVMVFDLNHNHPIVNKKKKSEFKRFLHNVFNVAQDSNISVYKFLTLAPYSKNIYSSYNIETIRIRPDTDNKNFMNYSNKSISKEEFNNFRNWIISNNIKLVKNESLETFYVLESFNRSGIRYIKVTDEKEDINDPYYRDNVSKICGEYFRNKEEEISQIIYVTYYPLIDEYNGSALKFYSFKEDRSRIINMIKN